MNRAKLARRAAKTLLLVYALIIIALAGCASPDPVVIYRSSDPSGTIVVESPERASGPSGINRPPLVEAPEQIVLTPEDPQ